MPVPFRDAAEIDELGMVGFLVLREAVAGAGFVGALFVINARGEPQEFTYSRVELTNPVLWRPQDVRRYAERSLVSALLDACPRDPLLLLARATDTQPDLFRREIIVGVPVVRVAPKVEVSDLATGEVASRLELSWYPAAPRPETRERRLIDELTTRGLLLEPFERADRGLDEVYDPESWSGPARSAERGARNAERTALVEER